MGGQADGQCAFVCGTGLQPAEPSLLQSGGLTGAPPTLVLVQGGVQKQPFSEFIRTFHTQDEFAKLLAGDACCFHPPAYQSDEASRAQSMPGTLAGAHRPAAPAPAAANDATHLGTIRNDPPCLDSHAQSWGVHA